MMNRREMLAVTAGLGASMAFGEDSPAGTVLNDQQGQLNATRVKGVVRPKSIDDLVDVVRRAKKDNQFISVAGGRHSMGAQQFGTDTVHVDSRGLDKFVKLDRDRGLLTVEAGMQWPELMNQLRDAQKDAAQPWTIRQKQTGVDRVTIGGSMASNIHGRGLKYPPMVGDIESFDIVTADGEIKHCDRTDNRDLFGLAIGGYGLFGIVCRVTLRLTPRNKVQRIVKIIEVQNLLDVIDGRIKDGFDYGDVQYQTDIRTDGPPIHGVCSCYKPVANDTPVPEQQRKLSNDDWAKLYHLARTDKPRAFKAYSDYYMSTSGQVYWNDTHQMSGNFQAYRDGISKLETVGTEVISEAHVPRSEVASFMAAARKCCGDHGMDLTYGTIRFIAKDDETFLNWAKEPPVCLLCNMHVIHTEAGIEKAKYDFRRLFELSVERGGRFYLTYHKWATRPQIEKGYPQFVDFLKLKRKYDPQERFQSDWYRHYREMFADRL